MHLFFFYLIFVFICVCMSKNLLTISKITTQYNVSRTTLLYRMRLFNIKPFITFDRIHLYLVSDLERVMLGKEKEES